MLYPIIVDWCRLLQCKLHKNYLFDFFVFVKSLASKERFQMLEHTKKSVGVGDWVVPSWCLWRNVLGIVINQNNHQSKHNSFSIAQYNFLSILQRMWNLEARSPQTKVLVCHKTLWTWFSGEENVCCIVMKYVLKDCRFVLIFQYYIFHTQFCGDVNMKFVVMQEKWCNCKSSVFSYLLFDCTHLIFIQQR